MIIAAYSEAFELINWHGKYRGIVDVLRTEFEAILDRLYRFDESKTPGDNFEVSVELFHKSHHTYDFFSRSSCP